MTTKLIQAFKRELDLQGEKYTLTVSPEGLRLVQKGKRKGIELNWAQMINGEAALATALNASLTASNASLAAAPPAFDLQSHAGRSHTKH